MKRLTSFVVIATLLSSSAMAQDAQRQRRGYPPEMPGARVESYKTVGDKKLDLFIFQPEGWKPSDKHPAIVCFFGGGWTSGSPQQFLPQCKYLASRGMVAIAADYRVGGRDHVKAVDCVRDAKSAIRYVRKNAAALGVDPDRIVAAGGSAGGHLAAACGTIKDFDEPNEDASISSKPNALLLFNPAVVLDKVAGLDVDEKRLGGLKERLGVNPRDLSPYHHISREAPPTAIFHGKADQTVPYATVAAYAKAMQEAGAKCELFGYEDQGHGFFNQGRANNRMFGVTLQEADKFLLRLGYLQGEPTLEESARDADK